MLLGVAFAQGAELTNAPIPGVTPPVSYTRTIQLYHVPVDYRSPAEVERDAKLRSEVGRLRLPGDEFEKALTAEPIPQQQLQNPAQRVRKKNPDDKDKAQDSSVGRKDDKAKDSGWGWLADNVRQAESRRSDLSSKQREEDEEEAAKKDADQRGRGRGSDGSNAVSRGEGEWAASRGGGRREPAAELQGGRMLAGSREARDARSASSDMVHRDIARAEQAPAPETPAPTWWSSSDRVQADPASREGLLGSLQPAAGVQSTWGSPSPALQSAWGNGLGLRPGEASAASPIQPAGGLLGGWNSANEALRTPSPVPGANFLQPDATPAAGAGLYRPAVALPSPALGSSPALPGIQTRALPW